MLFPLGYVDSYMSCVCRITVWSLGLQFVAAIQLSVLSVIYRYKVKLTLPAELTLDVHCKLSQKVVQVQITLSMQPFKIKSNGFHQNVPRFSNNKN